MKKVICLLAALVMMLSIAMPAFAAENTFVPSIDYKPDPEIVPVQDEKGEDYIGVIRDANGEILSYVGHGCILITPVAYIWDEEIEVSEPVRELLQYLYDALSSGDMTIPYDKHEADLDPANMVIRDLFDVRWVCDEHREMVEKEGVVFEITFDMGVVADAQLYAMTYDEETKEWTPVVELVNNGDGTVTCTFEHLCGVEFSMPVAAANAAVNVETVENGNATPWIVTLLAAAGAAVGVLVSKKKKAAV